MARPRKYLSGPTCVIRVPVNIKEAVEEAAHTLDRAVWEAGVVFTHGPLGRHRGQVAKKLLEADE